jgi:hypothetical protein
MLMKLDVVQSVGQSSSDSLSDISYSMIFRLWKRGMGGKSSSLLLPLPLPSPAACNDDVAPPSPNSSAAASAAAASPADDDAALRLSPAS